MRKLFVTSPNIIRDKSFRRRLSRLPGGVGGGGGAGGAADEAFEVVRQALEAEDDGALRDDDALVAKAATDADGNSVVLMTPKSDAPQSNNSVPSAQPFGNMNRGELEVKAKIFLRNFSFEAAKEALERVFKEINSDYLDSLQVTVPYSGQHDLVIAEQEKEGGPQYEASLQSLIELWQQFEDFVSSSTVRRMGLCDVETRTLRRLCDKARVKPSTISLNLASCCVVPPEMQEFAAEQGIKLVTHNDPEMILSEKRLSAIKDNQFGKLDWVIRYQVMDALRGVLLDKRYIVGLNNGLEKEI